MDIETWAPLLTGIIASIVALVGFLLNQIANRRERKSKVYAEAITTLKEYTELPYRIRRRAASDGKTRAVLGDEISNVLSRVGLYLCWLQIDSCEVGLAYRYLMDQTKRYGAEYRAMAWAAPIMKSDAEAALMSEYIVDNDPELENCLKVMRRELSPLTFRSRGKSRALLESQRKEREEPQRKKQANEESGLSPR
jgi:hypothetical protein